MVSCNVLVAAALLVQAHPHLALRRIFVLSLLINVGMWFERFVIIVTSLHRDFLPSSWSMYRPTFIEVGTLIGTFGLFFTLFLLFCRLLPMISIGEVKGVLAYAQSRESFHPAHPGGRMSPIARPFVAYFTREQDVLAATAAVRKAGLGIRDVFTPYAVHGLEAAMGLRRSRLSQVCFFAGLTGLTTMLFFAWWTSAVSWPLNVGGKPLASIPAFIPVTFEFTVLCAALITVAALFGVAKLWPGTRGGHLAPGDRRPVRPGARALERGQPRPGALPRARGGRDRLARADPRRVPAGGASRSEGMSQGGRAGGPGRLLLLSVLAGLSGCGGCGTSDPLQPGREYVKDMIDAVPYESFSPNPVLAQGMTLQTPAAGKPRPGTSTRSPTARDPRRRSVPAGS